MVTNSSISLFLSLFCSSVSSGDFLVLPFQFPPHLFSPHPNCGLILLYLTRANFFYSFTFLLKLERYSLLSFIPSLLFFRASVAICNLRLFCHVLYLCRCIVLHSSFNFFFPFSYVSYFFCCYIFVVPLLIFFPS